MTNSDEPIFAAEFSQSAHPSVPKPALTAQIRQLVQNQSFCILCTQSRNQPYGSLIAYAFDTDLKHFYFTTPKATRKFKLLSECQQVSLVIDSRCQHPDDMTRIAAVTVTGRALQLQSGTDYDHGIKLLKLRHPYLNVFLDAESTALFQIKVVRFFHVTRFQEVSQWTP